MQSKAIVGFVQDKWRLNPELTLSLGVRYDLEIIPIRAPVVAPLMDDDSDYPVDKNNFAPRLGLVYDVSGNGSAVVRGGYGMFYDRTSLTVVDEINRQGVYSSSFTALFPAAQADPGPSQGRLSDRSDARERSRRESRVARSARASRDAEPQHRHGVPRFSRPQDSRTTTTSRSATKDRSARSCR